MTLDWNWKFLIGNNWPLSEQDKKDLAAGGTSAYLVYQGFGLQDALREAKRGNILMLSIIVETLGVSYTTVQHAEKLLMAHRYKSLLAGNWPKKVAFNQINDEFGFERSTIYEAIKLKF